MRPENYPEVRAIPDTPDGGVEAFLKRVPFLALCAAQKYVAAEGWSRANAERSRTPDTRRWTEEKKDRFIKMWSRGDDWRDICYLLNLLDYATCYQAAKRYGILHVGKEGRVKNRNAAFRRWQYRAAEDRAAKGEAFERYHANRQLLAKLNESKRLFVRTIKRQRTIWTDRDITMFRELVLQGSTLAECSHVLRRPQKEVESLSKKLKLKGFTTDTFGILPHG